MGINCGLKSLENYLIVCVSYKYSSKIHDFRLFIKLYLNKRRLTMLI